MTSILGYVIMECSESKVRSSFFNKPGGQDAGRRQIMPGTLMKVHIFTHGAHVRGGITATTYDGPLSESGLEAVAQAAATGKMPSILQEVELGMMPAFRGIMRRHQETAMALGSKPETAIKFRPDQRCVNDADMFALMEDGNEKALMDWFLFLEEQRGKGAREIFVITSRVTVCAMLYKQGGGAKQFGSYRGFVNACDAMIAMQGAVLPLFTQANLTTWEWDGEMVKLIP